MQYRFVGDAVCKFDNSNVFSRSGMNLEAGGIILDYISLLAFYFLGSIEGSVCSGGLQGWQCSSN